MRKKQIPHLTQQGHGLLLPIRHQLSLVLKNCMNERRKNAKMSHYSAFDLMQFVDVP